MIRGMPKTLGWLASELGGEILGNPEIEIRRVVHPSYAEDEHDLALVYSASVAPIVKERAVQTALVPLQPDVPGIPNQLKVARPRVTLARLLEIFARPPWVGPGVHPSAVIDPTAQLANDVRIGPNCSVGRGAKIASGTQLIAGVHIGAEVEIGSDCRFFAGVCVWRSGADRRPRHHQSQRRHRQRRLQFPNRRTRQRRARAADRQSAAN
jgi:UDP-3-O-[3-hydroxymyristoyl] glucosamine N-acyltransferase